MHLLLLAILLPLPIFALAPFFKWLEKKTGKSLGNPHIEETLQTPPSDTMVVVAGGIIAPLVEESVLRLLPFLLVSYFWPAAYWPVGIVTALLFGLAHCIGKDKKLDFSRIPLPQIMHGLYYWWLIGAFGIFAPYYAHGVSNTLFLLWLIRQPDYKAFRAQNAVAS